MKSKSIGKRRRSKTRNAPANAADKRDRVTEAYYGGLGEDFMRETQRRIHWVCAQVRGERVLDIGCSQGIVPILLAREGKHVVGIDVDSQAIAEARRYLAAEREEVRERVELLHGDATQFELDQTFDTVLMTEVLEHLTQPDRILRSAARHLKAGGRLVVTVPFGINDFIDHKQTFYLAGPYRLLSLDFDVETVEILGHWIGLVAKKRVRTRSRVSLSLDLALVEKLEQGFLAVESELRQQLGDTKAHHAADSVDSPSNLHDELERARAEISNLRRLKDELAAQSVAAPSDRIALEDDLAAERQRVALEHQQLDADRHQLELERQRLAETSRQHAAELSRLSDERQQSTARIQDLEVRLIRLEADGRAQERASQVALEAAAQRTATLERLLEERQKELDRVWSLAREDAALAEKNARDREQQVQKARVKLERELGGLRARYEDLRTRFTDLKSNFNANEQSRLEAAQRLTEAHQQLAEAEHRLAELEHRASDAEQRLIEAGHRILETSGSTSYQLGSALVSAGTSFRGLISLPRRLIDVGRNVRIKREQQLALPALEHQPVRALERSGPTAASPIADEEAEVVSLTSAEWTGTLRNLRVATIADDFTFASYQPECNLFQLTPAAWREELELFRPELLFIESAWRGKDELWGSRVGHLSEEVRGIVAWCRERHIPTVFWNKEDPVHYSTFLNTARLFDHVFTTDFDCIHLYKAALGHDRVYLLPFAAQPAISNPIEVYERKDAFCFAGAYYVRYPERTRDLEDFIAKLPKLRPVEIFDRNFGKDDPNYAFPEAYRPFIVGNLPFAEIDRAYKGYRYAINLNSIKQSQTMFARRVFELLASNTLTISNYSRGLRILFGDLVIASDSGDEVARRLESLASDELRLRKTRLLALRKVMSEHTYEDRLAYIVSKVRGQAQSPTLPDFLVVSRVENEREAASVVDNYRRQSYPQKQLILVAPRRLARQLKFNDPDVSVMSEQVARDAAMTDLTNSTGWLAGFAPGDYYGPNYLRDLALATRYADAPLVGKRAHYAIATDSKIQLLEDGTQYRHTAALPARSAAARIDQAADSSLYEWSSALPDGFRAADRALAIDEFNYCRNAGANPAEDLVLEVTDLSNLDAGFALPEVQQRGERVVAHTSIEDTVPVIPGDELAQLLGPPSKQTHLSISLEDGALRVASGLAQGKVEYRYASARDFSPSELHVEAGQLSLHLECSPGLGIQLVCVFLDEKKKRIGHAIRQANRNEIVELIPGTARIRLGLRIYGPGVATVKCIVLAHRRLDPSDLFTRGRFLLVTNQYPSREELYRNAFVHRRVLAYRKAGVGVDVFRLRPGQALAYHEFENIDCVTGSTEALHHLIGSNGYQAVLVHCLDESMWSVLKHHISRVTVHVWVHGAEIQPAHRRDFNFSTTEQREAAHRESERRMTFWRQILDPMPPNLHLVFVSRHFAEEVMADLGIRLPDGQYQIIHNPIDTELFQYRPKPASQRYRVLSIRPYASAKYANDLNVKTIFALAEQPWFKRMEFRLIGDGPLFEETTAPLRGLSNVVLERRFVTQHEIAELHRHYGIFLSPTRWDSQGVSRDEAMSSGLVPITNAVSAVPEFVDETCAILAPPEDSTAMARGLESLLEDPDRFLAMSRAAAERVRRQSDLAHVVRAELAAIGK